MNSTRGHFLQQSCRTHQWRHRGQFIDGHGGRSISELRSNTGPTEFFPAAFHLDIDKDGKRDLLVSPNSRSFTQLFEGMWFYHNSGTDAAPIFEFQQNDLFQDRMLDFGEGACPLPFDHNGDGLMDLIVANAGYSSADPITKQDPLLALLENTGTTTAPTFNMITDDYMGLRTSGIGEAMYPAFADIRGTVSRICTWPTFLDTCISIGMYLLATWPASPWPWRMLRMQADR